MPLRCYLLCSQMSPWQYMSILSPPHSQRSLMFINVTHQHKWVQHLILTGISQCGFFKLLDRLKKLCCSVGTCCRLTINTKSNVLMMTFESIDWDYSNETDKVVTFVENNKYPDAPLRNHTYAYIRAQRMARTGSSDRRLLKKADKPRFSRCTSARSTTSGASMSKYI